MNSWQIIYSCNNNTSNGYAMVSASSANQAISILNNQGMEMMDGYSIISVQDMGPTTAPFGIISQGTTSKGEKGDKGDTGLTGPQGIKGTDGKNGKNAVSAHLYWEEGNSDLYMYVAGGLKEGDDLFFWRRKRRKLSIITGVEEGIYIRDIFHRHGWYYFPCDNSSSTPWIKPIATKVAGKENTYKITIREYYKDDSTPPIECSLQDYAVQYNNVHLNSCMAIAIHRDGVRASDLMHMKLHKLSNEYYVLGTW